MIRQVISRWMSRREQGGHGGKSNSHRGCAECSAMLAKTSLSAHYWTLGYCSKNLIEEKVQIEKKMVLFSDNCIFNRRQLCLKTKNMGARTNSSATAPFFPLPQVQLHLFYLRVEQRFAVKDFVAGVGGKAAVSQNAECFFTPFAPVRFAA